MEGGGGTIIDLSTTLKELIYLLISVLIHINKTIQSLSTGLFVRSVF